MTRHLVVGATGQVGAHLAATLTRGGGVVVGTGHSAPSDVTLDLGQPGAVREVLHTVKPEAVWIAGAYTHVDGCEANPETSWRVNVAGPLQIAEWASSAAASVVFFSSDYVFDGMAGPYREGDHVHPLSVYGRHKLAVEAWLHQHLASRSLVIRTAWVYGRAARGQGFIERLTANLRAGATVRLPNDQWGTPTAAADLAQAAVALWERGAVGTWHVAGPDYLSRDAWARQVARHFHCNPDQVEGVPTARLEQAAARPLYGGLVAEHAADVLNRSFWDGAFGLRLVDLG
jgi:dTDP-4-dehydrorhamnose reductase